MRGKIKMFVSNDIVYIEMQKTGCTHISRLLNELFDGEIFGKHNAASGELLKSNRTFNGTVD